ncbi:MAG: hypothetical protein EOP11_26685 [Proteobacteria bacterium]|nr:MAG: hypothetical protein EOP11_26685 [Pseudomonadota bacterium]
MLLAILIFVSAHAQAAVPSLVCQIHQEGVEWVEFRREIAPVEHTSVRVEWGNGSQSVLVMRENFNEWQRRGFVLALQSPTGRPLRLDVRTDHNGLYGFFRGSDGSPFPVSCVDQYYFLNYGPGL